MTADTLKWIGVVLAPITVLIGALLPNLCNFKQHSFALSLLKVFTGGILFGFGFLHVLSDANGSFSTSDQVDDYSLNGNSYPLVNAIALLSFFTMILIEQTVTNSFLPAECCNSSACKCTIVPVAHKGFVAYILTIGLSIHSFFEGLSIGLQTSTGNVAVILITILVHKWLESLSITLSFTSDTSRFKKVATLTIFSILTPLGIIVGILSGTSSDFAEAILGALAAGVLMYASLYCMLTGEFVRDNKDSVKIANKKLFLKMSILLVAAIATGFLSLSE